MNHKKLGLLPTVAALVISLAFSTVASSQPAPGAVNRCDFRSDMRKLWEDHVTWTRLYIVGATANLPEKDVTAKRLLQNQTDIGNAIKPFYGDAAGARLSTLLKDHILIAVEIIDAAMKGEAAKKDDAAKRWSANADDIATFLSGANLKNWPLAEMKSMMRDHLALTTAELVAHLQKDWSADVAAYDRAHNQILKMADMLSTGISSQFAAKFQ